jgi:hypothetical protein
MQNGPTQTGEACPQGNPELPPGAQKTHSTSSYFSERRCGAAVHCASATYPSGNEWSSWLPVHEDGMQVRSQRDSMAYQAPELDDYNCKPNATRRCPNASVHLPYSARNFVLVRPDLGCACLFAPDLREGSRNTLRRGSPCTCHYNVIEPDPLTPLCASCCGCDSHHADATYHDEADLGGHCSCFRCYLGSQTDGSPNVLERIWLLFAWSIAFTTLFVFIWCVYVALTTSGATAQHQYTSPAPWAKFHNHHSEGEESSQNAIRRSKRSNSAGPGPPTASFVVDLLRNRRQVDLRQVDESFRDDPPPTPAPDTLCHHIYPDDPDHYCTSPPFPFTMDQPDPRIEKFNLDDFIDYGSYWPWCARTGGSGSDILVGACKIVQSPTHWAIPSPSEFSVGLSRPVSEAALHWATSPREPVDTFLLLRQEKVIAEMEFHEATPRLKFIPFSSSVNVTPFLREWTPMYSTIDFDVHLCLFTVAKFIMMSVPKGHYQQLGVFDGAHRVRTWTLDPSSTLPLLHDTSKGIVSWPFMPKLMLAFYPELFKLLLSIRPELSVTANCGAEQAFVAHSLDDLSIFSWVTGREANASCMQKSGYYQSGELVKVDVLTPVPYGRVQLAAQLSYVCVSVSSSVSFPDSWKCDGSNVSCLTFGVLRSGAEQFDMRPPYKLRAGLTHGMPNEKCGPVERVLNWFTHLFGASGGTSEEYRYSLLARIELTDAAVQFANMSEVLGLHVLTLPSGQSYVMGSQTWLDVVKFGTLVNITDGSLRLGRMHYLFQNDNFEIWGLLLDQGDMISLGSYQPQQIRLVGPDRWVPGPDPVVKRCDAITIKPLHTQTEVGLAYSLSARAPCAVWIQTHARRWLQHLDPNSLAVAFFSPNEHLYVDDRLIRLPTNALAHTDFAYASQTVQRSLSLFQIADVVLSFLEHVISDPALAFRSLILKVAPTILPLYIMRSSINAGRMLPFALSFGFVVAYWSGAQRGGVLVMTRA